MTTVRKDLTLALHRGLWCQQDQSERDWEERWNTFLLPLSLLRCIIICYSSVVVLDSTALSGQIANKENSIHVGSVAVVRGCIQSMLFRWCVKKRVDSHSHADFDTAVLSIHALRYISPLTHLRATFQSTVRHMVWKEFPHFSTHFIFGFLSFACPQATRFVFTGWSLRGNSCLHRPRARQISSVTDKPGSGSSLRAISPKWDWQKRSR